MTAIEPSAFYAAFERFPDPVCLKTASGWLFNPAAESLGLSLSTLESLTGPGGSSTLWLSRQFYHATVTPVEDGFLVLLQRDNFLSGGSAAVANQLRQHLFAAFFPLQDLAELNAVQEDTAARSALSSVNKALFQILRAVEQLDMCSMEDNAFCAKLVPIDLVSFAKELCNELSPLCAQAEITLTAELEPRYLSTVADWEMLKFLFLHLISNSLKYTPKGGNILLSLRQQGEQAVFTLSDSAASLSPEVLNDPLWDQPTRMEWKRGLGLGLPIAQRIAAAHGGSLTILSAGDKPRVVVSLPLEHVSEIIMESPNAHVEYYAGFSPTMVVLSDALPPHLYFPKGEAEEFST